MSVVYRSCAVIGIMVTMDAIGKIEERKPSCPHSQRKGHKFCPECGVPSVDGYTRKDAFHNALESGRKALEHHATIGFVDYFHDDDANDPRCLIGAVARTDGDEFSYAASLPVPDLGRLAGILESNLMPLGLWKSEGVRLHVLMRADG